MAKAEIVARLTLVVEYEEAPSDSEIDELLDCAKQYGAVTKATFETLKLVKKELA